MRPERDSRTGVAIVRGALSTPTVYRVASSSRGPFDPPLRPDSASEIDSSWSRFDVPGGRTIYAGATRAISLAEVLAYFRLPVGQESGLAKDAAFLGLSPDELAAIVEAEWRRLGHMPPGHVARSWRANRLIYTLTLLGRGTWVVLEDLSTIGAIERALVGTLQALRIASLTISHLTGDNRILSVAAATWLSELELADGSRPIGVIFPSKHGGGEAYACWLSRPGALDVNDQVESDEGREIAADSAELGAVVDRFNLHVH